MSATVSMMMRHLLLSLFFQPDVTPDPPAGLWVALTYDVAPSNATGAQVTEPLLGAYARQSYGISSSTWAVSGFGEVGNIDSVAFPAATSDWGLVQGWALFDTSAVGTGHSYATGSLVTPTYVEQGRTIVVPPYAITLGLYD